MVAIRDGWPRGFDPFPYQRLVVLPGRDQVRDRCFAWPGHRYILTA